ncbi:MAG: hypothetical protein A2008_04680 [Candidatus Wallbacteria bacterium GWC2_49_35]|uniref:Uncharacterized protein n=1 Tax=Candidatus Wallbacteria bacterium GWC2_49_35 TaxID=1817813 RepID=A0A1F7WNC1_9BACT|nr:MAG: hypothetical protein A2008_04680 [Candidatus Wallbacteria bacterium GWC2_49_35]HBC73674.1 hypothetical protein [Candidatus Wallbacteria bacterium]
MRLKGISSYLPPPDNVKNILFKKIAEITKFFFVSSIIIDKLTFVKGEKIILCLVNKAELKYNITRHKK